MAMAILQTVWVTTLIFIQQNKAVTNCKDSLSFQVSNQSFGTYTKYSGYEQCDWVCIFGMENFFEFDRLLQHTSQG